MEWRDVKGYEGIYQINLDGQVKSFHRKSPIILKHQLRPNGYLYVELNMNGTAKQKSIHRLLAIAFIPNPHNKPCINHKDSNRLNNALDNLEWCTHSENNSHAHTHGNQRKYYGSKHHMSKLNETKAAEIRSKYVPLVYTMPMLAKEYGVSIGAIQSVLERKTWITTI